MQKIQHIHPLNWKIPRLSLPTKSRKYSECKSKILHQNYSNETVIFSHWKNPGVIFYTAKQELKEIQSQLTLHVFRSHSLRKIVRLRQFRSVSVSWKHFSTKKFKIWSIYPRINCYFFYTTCTLLTKFDYHSFFSTPWRCMNLKLIFWNNPRQTKLTDNIKMLVWFILKFYLACKIHQSQVLILMQPSNIYFSQMLSVKIETSGNVYLQPAQI